MTDPRRSHLTRSFVVKESRGGTIRDVESLSHQFFLVTIVYGMYGVVGACIELQHVTLMEAFTWPELERRH